MSAPTVSYTHPVATSATTATSSTATSTASKYRTYSIKSWHDYQQITPSHLHSIEHYYANCEELAKKCPEHVMVLRDEVTRITGLHITFGWSAQNCADTNGYADVRTGKKYPYGKSSFYEDMK